MKLVEILARELNEWPVWNPEFAYCDDCGEIRFRDETTCDFYPMEAVDLSDRGGIGYAVGQTKVTRDQWEAERARIAAEEAPAWHIGTETEGWRNECQKQYEQELWDKVAVAATPSVITAEYTMATPEQVVKYAFEYADAFMEERAKRLKK